MKKITIGLAILGFALVSTAMAEPQSVGQLTFGSRSSLIAFEDGEIDRGAIAKVPQQFFKAIVAKEYAVAWGLLTETTKTRLVQTSAKEAKMSEQEMRKLFDSNDTAIQQGFWTAFRGSCKAEVFVNFHYTYGRDAGTKHIVELRRPEAERDKPIELEVYDENGPKFGMAETFKL